jgi:hypothetical protein
MVARLQLLDDPRPKSLGDERAAAASAAGFVVDLDLLPVE